MKSKRIKGYGSFGFFLLGMLFFLFLGIAYGGEGTPVQLVSVSPTGGSYVSTTPEITLTYDKNVANITVRENNKSKISFLDSSGNEVLYHIEIADDEIYPLLRREIKVQVLEPLSPGTYKLFIEAGIGAKNGTYTGKAYTFYYRVKESKPVESTEAPTEATTEVPTEAPTEATTEAPTEAVTEAPTEALAESSTEALTKSESEEASSESIAESTEAGKETSKQEPSQSGGKPSGTDRKPGGNGENSAEPSGEVDPSGIVEPPKAESSKTEPSKAEPSKAESSARKTSPAESTSKAESSSEAEENLLSPEVILDGEKDGMQTVVLNRIVLTDEAEAGESLQAYEDSIFWQQVNRQGTGGNGIALEWCLGLVLFLTGLVYRVLSFRQSIGGSVKNRKQSRAKDKSEKSETGI